MEWELGLAFSAVVLLMVFSAIEEDTKRLIYFLSLQGAAVGIVQLSVAVTEFIEGLTVDSLMHFVATYAEWMFCVGFIPFMMYYGMSKTVQKKDPPIGGRRKTLWSMAILIVFFVFVAFFPPLSNRLPSDLPMFPFSVLVFVQGLYIMVTRRDALKIIIGLNLAENGLYPLLAELPLYTVPFAMGSIFFVNLIALYMITESFREHGTLLVSEWRGSGA